MTGHRRGGFSLIELLVVIIIIALVVAIVVPSLFGARNAARNASTQGLMTQVQAAAQKFETDNRRQPGHFTARQMGMQTNESQGTTAGENVMLDLAGGVVGTSGSPTGPDQIMFGPSSSDQVIVDVKRIGVGEVYFAPPEKFYKPQPLNGQVVSGRSGGANPTEDQVPDLVDAWDSPLLFWVKDETAARPIDPQNNSFLCEQNSGNGQLMTNSARYYWASNAGFLKATALGKKALDQTYVQDGKCSFLGWASNNQGITDPGSPSLEALLGSPNFPHRPPGGPIITPSNGVIRAAEGRASFIIHAAGADGYYLGTGDKGRIYAMPAGSPNNEHLVYAWTQYNPAVSGRPAHTDKDGKTTNIDIIKDFDDLLSSGTN